MKSGVRKSGWPIPRLMMSRPCAASALARASTAKAFSSPMRSKAAMVRSMAYSPVSLPPFAPAAAAASTGAILTIAADRQLGHTHHLEDHGDRPSDQQQPVERDDRAEQPPAVNRQRVAVAERGVVLERKLELVRAPDL